MHFERARDRIRTKLSLRQNNTNRKKNKKQNWKKKKVKLLNDRLNNSIWISSKNLNKNQEEVNHGGD